MRFKGVSTAAGFCVAILLLHGTAGAKGDGVEQITITGPGLEHQIEISDPITLDQFNPWGGLHRFIGGPVDEGSLDPETLAGPYKVRFLLDVHEWVYELSYYTVDGFEPAYIVLPEPNGDRGYRFVIPAGWYRSSDAWSEVMSERLVGAVAPRSGVELSDPKIDGSLLALGLVGAVALAFRRKVEPLRSSIRPGRIWRAHRQAGRPQGRHKRARRFVEGRHVVPLPDPLVGALIPTELPFDGVDQEAADTDSKTQRRSTDLGL